jgi:hypothetical protein
VIVPEIRAADLPLPEHYADIGHHRTVATVGF